MDEAKSFMEKSMEKARSLFGKAKVRVGEAFWAKSGTQGFRGLAEASLAQRADE